MNGIEGRVQVITGGYGGIAEAIAATLAAAGGIVVLTGRDAEKGEARAASVRAGSGGVVHFIPMDVTEPAAIDIAVDRIEAEVGPVAGLVVNAATVALGEALTYPDEGWRRSMAVNVDGAFFCARAFGRRMKGRGGAIVLISSIAGRIVTRPGRFVAYNVSKAAVTHMATALGVEWAPLGIRVNALEPGYVETDRVRSMRKAMPAAVETWEGDTPIGRLVSPTEVADATAFLLSDHASAITATSLIVDGGYAHRKG